MEIKRSTEKTHIMTLKMSEGEAKLFRAILVNATNNLTLSEYALELANSVIGAIPLTE